jgi:hypothetical protein
MMDGVDAAVTRLVRAAVSDGERQVRAIVMDLTPKAREECAGTVLWHLDNPTKSKHPVTAFQLVFDVLQDVTRPKAHREPCSRRVRKLYLALARVEAEMEAIARSKPCPEHAPTSCRIIRSRLRPLALRQVDLQRRIAALHGDD